MKVWTFEIATSEPNGESTVEGIYDSFEKAHKAFLEYIGDDWDEAKINEHIEEFGGDFSKGEYNNEYEMTFINEWEVK